MIFLLLLALILLVYFPTVYANPVWDDTQLWSDQDLPKWKPHWPMLRNPRWMVMASFGYTFRYCQRFKEEWRPTIIVAFSHLANIVIHYLNTVLVYWVASFLVADRAIVAALLFAVHPLAASTVAPIISRSSLLSTTFIFSAIGLTLSGHPFLALTLAVGAFWSKEDGISVVPLIIALTALQSPRDAALIVGLCILTGQRLAKRLITMAKTLSTNNGDIAMLAAGLAASLPQPRYSATAMVENLRRWPLWLFGFDLNPDPDPKERSLLDAGLTAILLWLLLVVALSSGTTFAAILFIIFLSPWTASWFFRLPDPVSEVRVYSTVLGMALLLSYLPILLVTPIVIWLAMIAAYRAWLQQNEIALWQFAWNEGSRKLRVALNLAAAYQRHQKLQEAFNWHQEALKIAPGNGVVLMNMALWFEGQTRAQRQEITRSFIEQGKTDPKVVEAAVQRANQSLAQAVALAREGIKNCPDDPSVQKFYRMIEDHAKSLGLTVQVVQT